MVRDEGGGALDSLGFVGDGPNAGSGHHRGGGGAADGEAGVEIMGIGAGEIFLVVEVTIGVGIGGLGHEATKDALAPLGEDFATEGEVDAGCLMLAITLWLSAQTRWYLFLKVGLLRNQTGCIQTVSGHPETESFLLVGCMD